MITEILNALEPVGELREYTVQFRYPLWYCQIVQVEAHNEEEAEQLARGQISNDHWDIIMKPGNIDVFEID